MKINKIYIQNFKGIESFDFDLNTGLNILVGNNETGKSTILEAIYLCLTGIFRGRRIQNEFSPFLFNKNTYDSYLKSIIDGKNLDIPKLIIELYLHPDENVSRLVGTNNTKGENVPGVKIETELDAEFIEGYQNFIACPENVKTFPSEYFKVNWFSFANHPLTKTSIPVNATLIDATSIRLQYGTDYYLNKIINDHLSPKEKTELSIEYRKLKESFSEQTSINAINSKLAETRGEISDKEMKVSLDISTKASWEANLIPYLDDIPFDYIGQGDQSISKILLALDRQTEFSDLILIEEPENHLSFVNMSKLINKIKVKCEGKQILISTHSTYVANKLGLENLVLFGPCQKIMKLTTLPEDTQEYFKRLPGYDTLRFILSDKVILVEGPSDELFVQKAYRKQNDNKLPIEDGVDIISVRGLSFKRFLQIAKIIKNQVVVITDNDGDFEEKVKNKYLEFEDDQNIKIYADNDNDYQTLESQIVKFNELKTLNAILNRTDEEETDILNYMKNNKTECALRFFETNEDFIIPEYIANAISQ
jgi:predicted ATP-dependent endonuclease of OLD family